MILSAKINSGRLEYSLAHFSDDFYPYFYRGLRRAAAAYRREFVNSLAGKLKNPKRFSGRWPWGFFWKGEPRSEKSGDIDDISVSIFSTSTAAEQLEHGATIKPRTRKMLAVPFARALTATGRPKREFRSPASAKAAGHHVVARWRPNNRWVLGVKRPGKRTKFRPMWVLTNRVVIEPRLGFYDGWESFQPEARRRMDEEADKFWQRHFGQRSRRSA
jgi:hypothetical protein